MRIPRLLRNPFVIIAVLVVGLGLGFVLAKFVALPIYKEQRQARLITLAERFYKEEDYSNANLTIRRAYLDNPDNVELWRLAVAIAEDGRLPEFFGYMRELIRLEPTVENRLKLARIALQAGSAQVAAATLAEIGADHLAQFLHPLFVGGDLGA
ncbi:MAG: hypothetical protein EA425_00640, partial [Puniceicoccaceae bacterium]